MMSPVQIHGLLRGAALGPETELAVPHDQGGAGHQLLQEQVHPPGIHLPGLLIHCLHLCAEDCAAFWRIASFVRQMAVLFLTGVQLKCRYSAFDTGINKISPLNAKICPQMAVLLS